jgi:Zn-dependent alcohol dehydrogenase
MKAAVYYRPHEPLSVEEIDLLAPQRKGPAIPIICV